METGEGQHRPQRPPMPRHRGSIDGVSTPVSRPPIRANAARPNFSHRDPAQFHQPPRPIYQAPIPQSLSVTQPQPQSSPVHAWTPPPSPPAPPEPQPTFDRPFEPSEPRQPFTSVIQANAPVPKPLIDPEAPATPTPPALPSAIAPVEPEPELEPVKIKKPRKPLKELARWQLFGRVVALIAVALVLLAGGFWLFRQHTQAANPSTMLQDALRQAMSTKQVSIETISGPNDQTTNFDFTTPTNLSTSSTATVAINGSNFNLKGYGTLKDSYFSYSKFPLAIDTKLSSQLTNAWVHVRNKGTEPAGVSGPLYQVADPHYQIIGPVVFGNFTPAERDALLKFIGDNTIYSFDGKQGGRDTIAGHHVLTYTVTLNTGSLLVLNQNAALSEGIDPNDIQAAIDHLSTLRGATLALAIDASKHQLVQIAATKSGQTTIYDYSNFGSAQVSNEPQTRVTWDGFSPYQLQIEQQAASRESAASLDSARQSDLKSIHQYLATFYSNNNFYPLITELSNQGWVQGSIKGADPDIFRDPMSTSVTLAPAPIANIYAYSTTPAGCDNTPLNPCLHYQITATLTTGMTYSLTDLDK